MKVFKGFKTELAPNDRQRTLLLKSAGAARWAYNWGLSQKKAALDAKVKVPGVNELNKRLNVLKKTDLPWMYEVSKCCPQEALKNLDAAFKRFWGGRKKSRKVGFPRFKSKRRGVGGFRLSGDFRVGLDHVRLPRLGAMRLKESGYIPAGAKALSATVTEHAGRWFVSVLVEVEQPEFAGVKDTESIVGVDLGVKTLAVVSDGQTFANPKTLGRRLKKLRRLQQSVSRKVKGSSNKKKAAKKVARLHYRIGCVRKDTLHKITTQLTKTKSVVVIEDLNVSGMVKNRRLARAISDVGFWEFRRQLQYKAPLYGCRVVVVNRYFPSSKMCSTCGVRNDALTLNDRTWICECGVTHECRDLNAAINLRNAAVSPTEA